MKKKKIFSNVLVALLVVGGLFVLTGCGKDLSTEVTLDERYYKATFTVPATKDGGEIEPNYKEEEELQWSNNDCGIANDKVAIEFKTSSWSYRTYANYKEKYGDKEGNFANYVEYMKDTEFDSQKTIKSNQFKETTVGKYDALTYKWNGAAYYVLDIDGLKSQLQLIVIPLNDEDKVSDLLEDPEIKSVIDSLKIEVK